MLRIIELVGAALILPVMIWLSIRFLRLQKEANGRVQEDMTRYRRSELYATASKQHMSMMTRCLALAAVLFGIAPALISPQVNLPVRTCYYYAWICLLSLVLLMLVLSLVRYVVVKPRPDSVLSDLGEFHQPTSDKRAVWSGPVLFCIFSLTALVQSDFATGSLFAAMAVANSIDVVMTASARIQLTDQGIVRGCDFVAWQQIEAYEFGPEGDFLVYTIRCWLPLFRVVVIPVSEDNREAVQQAFNDYVGARQK